VIIMNVVVVCGIMVNVILLCVIMTEYCRVECHYAGCHFTYCHNAECSYSLIQLCLSVDILCLVNFVIMLSIFSFVMLGVIMFIAVTPRITMLNDVMHAVCHYADRQYNQYCYAGQYHA
jgi:hypothetical protein